MKEDSFQKFVKEARENRRKFLEPHKAEFARTRDPKIIIDLIKLEPTHLEEPWIVQEVIRWLLDEDSKDLIEAAFIRQTERQRPTAKGRKDYFLVKKIDRIIREEGVSVREACKRLADMQPAEEEVDEKDPRRAFPMWKKVGHDLEGVIRDKYRRLKKAEAGHDSPLPRPYYGIDCWLPKP
jgi:hypothetical protein